MTQIEIRIGTADDLATLADAFRQMWFDNDVPPGDVTPNHREVVRRFVEEAVDLQFFVAENGDGEPVGVACCQRFTGLYPAILTDTARDYGYIWGVWVDESERRQGLGALLTVRCLDRLRDIGCTHAQLNAAPMGKNIYAGLGFEPANLMSLDLRTTAR